MHDLTNISEGDLVIYEPHYSSREIRKVARLTNTQIVIVFKNGLGNDYEKKFHKKNGREVGGSEWTPCYIRPANPEDIREIRESALRRGIVSEIRSAKLDGLSTDRLERIAAILREDK